MPIVDAYAERKAKQVMRSTWGHMDARPGVKYPGAIVFAEGAFGGDRVVLSSEFGDEAGYGPWFYEGIHGWLFEQDIEPGKVYRFEGWYRLTHAGDHEFVGEVRALVLGEKNGET